MLRVSVAQLALLVMMSLSPEFVQNTPALAGVARALPPAPLIAFKMQGQSTNWPF
jgi:hypothetical protein